MKKELKGHASYMYRQGTGWIVGQWDEAVRCYRLSNEMPYGKARAWVGEDNCRHAHDGQCDKITHSH